MSTRRDWVIEETKKTKPNSYFLCLIPHVLLLLVKQTINPMLEGWVDGGESDWMRNRQKKFSPFITYNPDCIKRSHDLRDNSPCFLHIVIYKIK